MRTALTIVALLLLAVPARATDGSFDIKQTDARAAVGAKATASVTITAKQGWHLNQEAPLTLKLTPPAGVTVDKPKLGRGDLAASSESAARFDVGLTLSAPGKQSVEAEAGFVLCRQDSCRPIKQKLTLAAEATPPPAPKAGHHARKKKS